MRLDGRHGHIACYGSSKRRRAATDRLHQRVLRSADEVDSGQLSVNISSESPDTIEERAESDLNRPGFTGDSIS